MMDLYGHEEVRAGLVGAVRRGALPGSLLIHGPPGVGRQTLALWLGRLLVCEAPADDGPCGRCRACHLALDLQHPDVHWFFPLPRPKRVSGPDRLAEALEEARFEALEERRSTPLYQPPPDEPAGLYLAQVRTIRRLSATRPAMGSHQVFVVGDAEHLVPQEASEEAANAFLKILEEPPSATTFILTAREPEALLPTLRSRLLHVRLRPFPRDDIQAFLEEHADAEPADARLAARLARGSIGRALSFLPTDDGPSHSEALRQRARSWLEAALGKPASRYAAAHAERPAGSRGAFSDGLDFLALWLRDLAAVATGAKSEVVDIDALDRLETLAARIRPEGIPGAIQRVEEARDGAGINANPQLTLAILLDELAEALAA